MTFTCRLCGSLKHECEEGTTINQENKEIPVSLADLIDFFCRIELDSSPLLETRVCRACKQTVEDFCVLSDAVEKHQEYLRRTVIVKSEIVKKIIEETIQKPAIKLCSEATPNFAPFVEIGISDEDLDSPVTSSDQTDEVNGYEAESSSSGTNERLEKKFDILKPCCISLERLDIDYIHSDTSSAESDDEIMKQPRSKKRPHQSPGKDSISPSKRMRLEQPSNSQEVSQGLLNLNKLQG